MRFLGFFIFICSFSQAQQLPIDAVLETCKSDKTLINGTYAYCVMEAQSGKILSEYNSHIFVIPASTLKIVTTAAGLGTLGKFYRYDTRIYFTGTFNKTNGVLNGDIIIRGSGDPTLNSELFKSKKDTTDITDKWAEILKQKGLKELNGKIIGDASCYGRHIPSNWVWGDISNYFGVAPCGLSFNDNLYSVYFSTGATGSKAEVLEIKPNYTSITLEHDISVTAAGKEDDAYVFGDPFGPKKTIQGTIPPNSKRLEVRAALPDPALMCAEYLQRSLNKAGITTPTLCAASVYEGDDPLIKKEKSLMHTHYSSSLEKIVYHTNLTSNNLFCETILKTIGGGSNYSGINKVKEYWKNKGLDVSELFMVDGNGLSRANTVTTYFETGALHKLYNDSIIFKSFYNSLPTAGLSGSMRNIGNGTFIEKNMKAKTGYINRARGYCGYVKSKSGKDLCFSVLFNNYSCSASEMKKKIEQLLIAIAEL